MAPATPQLEYSENLNARGMNRYYYRPQGIDMLETPPETGWIEPEPRGRLRLYGIIPFAYGNNVRVIVDELDDVESEIVFAFDDDKDFRDNPVWRLPERVSFSLFYPDGIREQYAIHVYYPIDFGRRLGAYPA